MTQLPIGLIALIVVSFLIYFGLAHRVLDRMRLSDKAALAVIAALIVGSFITIPLPLGDIRASINVGGALIPIALAIYLLSKAGTTKERVRAVIATAATGLVVYYIGSVLMTGHPEPAGRFGVIDSLYLYPIAAAITGYIVGRSRRSAFIAAVLGVVLVDVFHYVWLLQAGAVGGVVAIGGAGAFDVTVLAGILAVLLAEIFGELRERLQGGPATEGRPKELLAGLKKPEFNRHDENAGAKEMDNAKQNDNANLENINDENELRNDNLQTEKHLNDEELEEAVKKNENHVKEPIFTLKASKEINRMTFDDAKFLSLSKEPTAIEDSEEKKEG